MITSKFTLNNYTKPIFLNTGRKAGNCSYFYKNDKKYLITRETDYIYGYHLDNVNFEMYLENDGTNIVHSDESRYECDSDGLKFIKKITKAEGNDWGFEDPRVASWDGKNYLLFSRRSLNDWNNFQVNWGKLDDEFNYVDNVANDGKQLVEKNWQPIEGRPGLCIYSVKPFEMIDLFSDTYIEVDNHFPILLRGSSNIIRYRDGYLGIYHIRNEAFEYLHYVVLYDDSMHLVKMSEPFSFFGANVEFNCYIEYVDCKFVLLVSVHDQLIYEFTFGEDLMRSILEHTLTNSKIDLSAFDTFYNDAKLSNNFFSAIVFSTFCKNREIIAEAITMNSDKNYFRPKFQPILNQILLRNYKECKYIL